MLSGEGNDNRSRVRFFGRIQKRICDLRTCGFFTTKNTLDPKRIIYDNGIFLVHIVGRKQHTDPRGEDKGKIKAT